MVRYFVAQPHNGVPYSTTDPMVGLWAYNAATEVRHLLALLKKRHLCNCGCRGWCSYHAVFSFLRWCLEGAADGRYPSERWDGPWQTPRDDSRQCMGGNPLTFVGAVIGIKGGLDGNILHLRVPSLEQFAQAM